MTETLTRQRKQMHREREMTFGASVPKANYRRQYLIHSFIYFTSKPLTITRACTGSYQMLGEVPSQCH